MATQAIRISPQDEAEKQQVSKLFRMLIQDGTAALVGPENQRIDLPPSIYRVLVRVVENMQEGKSVAVMPMMEELTTQAAADILGMSRQFLVRELESEKIPFHKTGAHRRIYLKDVLDYKNQRDQVKRASLARIAQKAEELGVYDTFVDTEE